MSRAISVDAVLRHVDFMDESHSVPSRDWRIGARVRRERLIREIFAPMPLTMTGATVRQRARPEWHFALVAVLLSTGWSRSQLADRYGGSAHTWSARIAEARRRGLLTADCQLTAYGQLLRTEVEERVR